MPNKVPGSPGAIGYWGRSTYKRVVQEQTPGKVRALLQDKLLARGVSAFLYLPVTSGVACTCRKDTKQTSDRPCPECYGTGFVPGYTRFLHETLFFTASQTDTAAFATVLQSLSPSTLSSTQVFAPDISTPNALQSLGTSTLANLATIQTPGVANANSLRAPALSSLASVMSPTVTTSVAAMNNVMLTRQFKPNYMQLVDGATTGFLQTNALPYYNPRGAAWEAQSEGYERVAGNSVVTTYSYDGGQNFHPLADIASTNPPPAGHGTLIFRVTLSRTAATDRSPYWSAVRARHANSHNYNRPHITQRRGNVTAGEILVLRPWIVSQRQSDTGRGNTVDWMSDRSWTAPLDFFDLSVPMDTPAARVSDDAAGPHPFYQYTRGIKAGDRIVMSSIKWNEEFGIFTHQSFDERRAQPSEPPYADVF